MMDVPKDFKGRQEHYIEKWGHMIDSSWKKNLNHFQSVFHLLQFSRINTVVELGCSDGGLAVEILNNIHYDLKWTGYDFMPNEIEASQSHSNYEAHLLDRFLWDMDEVPPFDVFVASHVFEHLYPKDIYELFDWLNGRASFIVAMAPLGRTNTPERGGHIIGVGFDFIRSTLKQNGFIPIWDMGRWFGWFVKK